jgi:hypothetical protein
MTFYCRLHPDFEGLTIAAMHDHIERDHRDIIQQGRDYKESIARFFRENVEMADFRRSDGVMVQRSWGRPPKLGQFTSDNETEKKR